MILFTGRKGEDCKDFNVYMDAPSITDVIENLRDVDKYKFLKMVETHYLDEKAEDYELGPSMDSSNFPNQIKEVVKQYGGVTVDKGGDFYIDIIDSEAIQDRVKFVIEKEIESYDKMLGSAREGISDEDLADVVEEGKIAASEEKDQKIVDSLNSNESLEDLAGEELFKIPEKEVSISQEELNNTLNNGGEIVQKAPHYQNIPIKDRNGNVVELEAWEIITSILEYLKLNSKASWAMGDALKYILRCGRKFGDEKAKTKDEKAVQDLRKVAYYINKVADWY